MWELLNQKKRSWCSAWYESDSGPPKGLPPCPPLISQADADPRYIKTSSKFVSSFLKFFHEGVAAEFRALSSSSHDLQQCLYDQKGKLLQGQPSGGSSNLLGNPGYYWLHFKSDLRPWFYCCYRQPASNCHKYFNKRPSDPGFNYIPPGCGKASGIGQILTIDGLFYKFNGAGEFWILKQMNEKTGAGFYFQGRMEKIPNSANISSPSEATIFTAFSMKAFYGFENGSSNIIQVELSDSRGLDILMEGVPLVTSDWAQFSLIQDGYSVSVSDTYFKSINISFKNGFAFSFKNNAGAISVIIFVDKIHLNSKIKGLLGNFDGIKENDFQTPDGKVIRANSLKNIHYNFGLLWRVTQEETILHYTYDRSIRDYSFYSYPDFLPIFSLPNISEILLPVLNLCRNSISCLFNYAATGDIFFAHENLLSDTVYEKDVKSLNLHVILCNSIDDPINGYADISNGLYSDSTIYFECEWGFFLKGNNSIYCDNGIWNGKPPSCDGISSTIVMIVVLSIVAILLALLIRFRKTICYCF